MYDLKLDASATGQAQVAALADAVASLAKNLPGLARELGLLGKIGDIENLGKAAIAVSSLNASIGGSDATKIKAMATEVRDLAKALAELGAQKVPSGLGGMGGATGGFKQAAEMRAMVDTMATANQAVATALAELSSTIRSGYTKAAKTTVDGGQAAADATETAGKKRSSSQKAELAQLQRDYEAEIAARRKFDAIELGIIQEAGVKLMVADKLRLEAAKPMSSLDKDRLQPIRQNLIASGSIAPEGQSLPPASVTRQRVQEETPLLSVHEAANVFNKTDSAQWDAYEASMKKQTTAQAWATAQREEDVKKRQQINAMYKANDAEALSNQRMAEASAAEAVRQEAARLDTSVKNQQASLKAKAALAQEMETLAQRSAKANAGYSVATPEQQLKSQIGARSQLDAGVDLSSVVSQYGSIATQAAKTADSVETLREKLTIVGDVKANTAWYDSMVAKTAEMTAKVTDDLAKVQDRIALANASFERLGSEGKFKSQAGATLGAYHQLDQGVSETQVRAQFGDVPVDAAKAAESLAALQVAYKDATNSVNNAKAAVVDNTLAMRLEGEAIDRTTLAKIEAAKAAGNHTQALKLEAEQARRNLSAGTALASGQSVPEVSAKFGNIAADTASANGLPALAQHAEHLAGRLANATGTAKGMEQALNTLHSAARGAASGFGAMFLTWGQIAPLLAGAALSNALVQTVKIGSEVGQQLQTMRALSGESEESVKGLSDEMFRLSTSAVGIRDVATAAKDLSLAGLNAGEVKNALSDVINLSIAGTTSLASASSTLVSVSTAFGYSSTQFGAVGDIIAKTAAMSMAGIQDMSEAFKTSTTIAEQYGVSLTDVATSLAGLAQRGITGTAAGTSTRQMFEEFTGRTAKTAKFLKEMNINPFDGMSGSLKPLIVLMYEMDTAMAKLSKTAEVKLEGKTFNERASKDVNAMRSEYLLSMGQLGTAEGQGKLGGKTAQQTMKGLVDLQAKGDVDAYAAALQHLADVGAITEKGMLGMQHQLLNTSAGFAALARASMDTSTENMMKSVSNTMTTSFAQAFASIDDAVAVVTVKMKALFGSDEFKQGIIDLATAASNLGMILVEHIGLITAALKAWLLFKAAAMMDTVFASAAGGLDKISKSFTAMAASTELATTGVKVHSMAAGMSVAASEATVLANTEVAASSMAASGGITFMGGAAARLAPAMAVAAGGARLLISALGPIAAVATAAYLAYELFWKNGASDVTAAEGAKARSETYIKSLEDQKKHLDDLIAAKKENLSLDSYKAKQSTTLELADLKKMRDGSISEGDALILKGQNTQADVLGDKYQTYAALPAKDKKAYQEQNIALPRLRDEVREAQKLIDQGNAINAAAIIKFEVEKTRIAALIKDIQDDSKTLAEKPKAPIKTGGDMPGDPSKLASVEAAELKRLEASFREDEKVRDTAFRREKALSDAHISADAGNAAKQMADRAEFAAVEDAYYADRIAAAEVYSKKVDTVTAKIQKLLAKPDKKTDINALNSAIQDSINFKDKLAGDKADSKLHQDVHEINPKAAALTTKEDSQVDQFLRKQQADIDAANDLIVIKSKSIGMGKDEIAQMTELVKVTKAYKAEYALVDNQIAQAQSALTDVLATIAEMSDAGPGEGDPIKLRGQMKAADELRARLTALSKERDKLVTGEKANKATILSQDAQNKMLESVELRIAMLQTRRDQLVDSIDTQGRAAFTSIFDGTFSFKKMMDAFAKSLKTAMINAFYDDFLQAPLKNASKSLAKFLFPDKDKTSGLDLNEKAVRKAGADLRDWWSGKEESGGPGEDKVRLGGMGDKIGQAWDRGMEYLKNTDWGDMWSDMTTAFKKVKWSDLWDWVKGLFTGGKPGESSFGDNMFSGALNMIGLGSLTKGSGGSGGSGPGSGQGSAGATDISVDPTLAANGHAFTSGGLVTAFASGSAFANSIVDTPTYFKYGGANLGMMGEAGPEAIVPLGRDSQGRLGIRSAGGGGGGGSQAVVHNTYLTYHLGGGVTRSDLASYGSQIVQVAQNTIADSVKRGDSRFTRSK